MGDYNLIGEFVVGKRNIHWYIISKNESESEELEYESSGTEELEDFDSDYESDFKNE